VLVLLAALTAGAGATAASAAAPQTLDEAAAAFEALLKDAGYVYTKPDPQKPTYRIALEDNGEAAVIVCYVWEASWKHRDESPVYFVNFYAQVGPAYSKEQQPPTALLRKLAEINNTRINTFFGLQTYNDGQWALFINGGLYLHGLDKEVVSDYLWMMFNSRNYGRQQLLPFMTEATE
jgi:hypothetical protein